jgi:AcrR family transcriptional regulator
MWPRIDRQEKATENLIMPRFTPKQRELLKRKEAILSTARDLIRDLGYHGLTMDRIADALNYSKGTIYQHFHCKEEVISGIARRALEKQVELQKRAAAWEGNPRERMVAVGEAARIFFLRYPDEIHFIQTIQTQAIREKSSEEIQEAMKAIEYQSQRLMADIVRDAIAAGDLVLPKERLPEEIVFALWAFSQGGQVLSLRGVAMDQLRVDDPYDIILWLSDKLGDGLGWRPLSTQADYHAVRQRIRAEIFPEEMARLRRHRPEEKRRP